MTVTAWIFGISLGLAANVLAEALLALDLRRPFRRLDAAHKCLRVLRWLVCVVGLTLANALNVRPQSLVLLALFSVSAATDLETKFLPPDWFVYGSVIVALAIALLTSGWSAFRDAAVAQAFCFAIVTLGVAFFNLCDSGDIKLSMQFGAACGSLGVLAFGAFGMWLAACVMVIGVFIREAMRTPISQAWHCATHLRPPQGPLMWCGVLFAMWMTQARGMP